MPTPMSVPPPPESRASLAGAHARDVVDGGVGGQHGDGAVADAEAGEDAVDLAEGLREQAVVDAAGGVDDDRDLGDRPPRRGQDDVARRTDCRREMRV